MQIDHQKITQMEKPLRCGRSLSNIKNKPYRDAEWRELRSQSRQSAERLGGSRNDDIIKTVANSQFFDIR